MTTVPGVEDREETTEQPSDAEKVRAAFTPEPEPPAPQKRGPGRPKMTAKQRSEHARRAALAGAEKRRQAATPAAQITPAEISPEEARFWGEQLASFWNQVAFTRSWPMMPGAPVDEKGLPQPPTDADTFLPKIGEPMARTMQNFLPTVDQRPWLQVLIIMLPFIGGAARVEFERVSTQRAAREDRRDGVGSRDERSRVRAEGQRQDNAREEFIGAPIIQQGADS